MQFPCMWHKLQSRYTDYTVHSYLIDRKYMNNLRKQILQSTENLPLPIVTCIGCEYTWSNVSLGAEKSL